MKEGTRVLVSLGVAIALGAAIAASGNAQAHAVADSIAPIGALWVTAIRMTVLPLITALIVTGVASAANVRDIGRLGARTLLVFVALLLGAAVVSALLAPLLFSLLPDGARPPLPEGAAAVAGELAGGSETPTVASWLTSLLPSNPVTAAANGAMVPFILFVLAFGIAVAHTAPPARATLLSFFQSLADAMMTMVRGVIWLAPIGVFATVLPMAARAGGAVAGGIGLYIVAYSVLSLAVAAAMYPAVGVFGGIHMRQFARAVLPAQLIALSSSSSLAALPALVTSAETTLQLPTRVTGFVLPLAGAMFKSAAPSSWLSGVLFISWFYHIPLSASQIALVAAAAVCLGFASPGIPRGAFIMLTPILVSVGLPVEGVGILIAVDAIPDVFATVLNTTGNLAATVIVARDADVAPST